jgi:hypothetical protein
MTTRGSAGHVLPLAPFGHACLRAGHDVLVAAQRQHEGNVVRAGMGLAGVEELGVRTAGPGLSQVRVEAGLPADPTGDRLREAPCLTVVPEPLDAAVDVLAAIARQPAAEKRAA